MARTRNRILGTLKLQRLRLGEALAALAAPRGDAPTPAPVPVRVEPPRER